MMKWFFTLSDAITETVAPVAAEEVMDLTTLPLMTKGLITTVIGLLGVFLVLTLFFVTIKLMQRIKTKDAK
ncbi:MAG: hypothetical protein GX096_07720 [Clostridiales bacterium]|nr:hypothetical protein [Clostridiales bacterium]